MSHFAVSWAYLQTVPKSEKFVLVTIADIADASGVAWPGSRKLASLCSCDEATIVRIMKKLEAETCIARVERRRENGKRASDWIVVGPSRSADDRRPMRPPGDQEQYPDAILALLASPRILQGDVTLHSEDGSPCILSEGHLAKSGGPIDTGEPPEEPSNGTTTPVAPASGGLLGFRTGEPRREGFERRKRETSRPVPETRTTAGTEAEWVRILTRLGEVVDQPTYNIWLRDLRPLSLSADEVIVAAPPERANWIAGRFRDVLDAAAEKPVRVIADQERAA